MHRHLWITVVVSSMTLLGCLGDPSGPPDPISARLAIVPVFAVAGGAEAAGIVEIAQTRVRIVRSDSSVVLDSLLNVPEGADSIILEVSVEVSTPGETFVMTLDFITPTGEIAFRGGPVTVQPVSSADAAPVPVEVVTVYVGVGANAASMRITNPGAILLFGGSVTLTAEALDAQGQAIAETPIAWSSLDPALATVPDPAMGSVVAGTQAGPARIVATLLTGPADTVTVMIEPPGPLQLRVTVQPSNVVVGRAVSPAIEVTVEDALGNVVLDATNTVTFALENNPSGAALLGPTSVAAINGVASFDGLAVSRVGAGYTLTASSGTLSAATSEPFDVVPSVPRLYVANASADFVSVIDVSTNTVVDSVTVGLGPADVAVTPDGAFAYVSNAGSANVSVIATATNTVVTTIPVDSNPLGIEITPNGQFAYLVHFAGTVTVIDLATNGVVATVTVGTQSEWLAVTPDGGFVWAPDEASGIISVIETTTHSVVTTFPAGTTPVCIAFTPDGAFAYIADVALAAVVVIETSGNSVVDTIPVGTNPLALAITPDGTRGYVANGNGDDLSVIDLATNTVITTIVSAGRPIVPVITRDGSFVYVTNQDLGTVSVIDTATNTVIVTIPVGPGATGLALTP